MAFIIIFIFTDAVTINRVSSVSQVEYRDSYRYRLSADDIWRTGFIYFKDDVGIPYIADVDFSYSENGKFGCRMRCLILDNQYKDIEATKIYDSEADK